MEFDEFGKEKSYGGFNTSLYGTYVNDQQQKNAGINQWDSEYVAHSKLNYHNQVMGLDQYGQTIVPPPSPIPYEPSWPSTPAPAGELSYPNSPGPHQPRYESGTWNRGDSVAPNKPSKLNPKVPSAAPTEPNPSGLNQARATKHLSWSGVVFRFFAGIFCVSLIVIFVSLDWTRSKLGLLEQQAEISLFENQQFSPASSYSSLTKGFERTLALSPKELAIQIAKRKVLRQKYGSPERLQYAAAAWNCVGYTLGCLSAAEKPNSAIHSFIPLAEEWLTYASKTGSSNALSDYGLWQIKKPRRDDSSNIGNATAIWQTAMQSNPNTRIESQLAMYSNSTSMQVLRRLREWQALLANALSERQQSLVRWLLRKF